MAPFDLDTSQTEARVTWVRNFKDALPNAKRFTVSDSHSGIVVASKKCAFMFGFERRSTTKYTLMVSEPSRLRDGMAFFIVRQLLGARGSIGTPTELASLVQVYFSRLLDGDFSIRRKYEQLEGRMLNGFFEIQKLPADHPIRLKVEVCDISWLDDIDMMVRRSGAAFSS